MLVEKKFSVDINGKTITVGTGKLAQNAGGAVTIRVEDSLLLATATMDPEPSLDLGFLPLSVDYEERLYAGGRIPGSFFRREGRPSETAILISRLIDRSLRPLFPKDMRNPIQVILYSLSYDEESPIDVLGIVAASAAVTISEIPFAGPVAAVRVSTSEGELDFNPSFTAAEESDLDLVLAGTRDAIMMVEAGAREVDEATMVAALEEGHKMMQPLIQIQDQLRESVGKEKVIYPSIALPEGAVGTVQSWIGDRLDQLLSRPLSREELYDGEHEIRDAAVEALVTDEEGGLTERDVRQAFGDVFRDTVREKILKTRVRVDGRPPTEIRPLSMEVDLSPRAHGSGLFTRGGTQVLTLATLGTPRERQELDILQPVQEKRYMHHYNFPPFSVGEVRRLRGATRREVGHGALAERALVPVLPDADEFPYTMRLVSEVLMSNGSTSMASVCGSTLALMDTGVPIRAPVAGIAMGLVKGEEEAVILTDILGVEDHLGDMDFKVAGTRKGINALQMDIKIKGISSELLSKALAQAREARLFILDQIEALMPEPRTELKPHAPRMDVIKIDPLKIGAVIGPGGKTIRNIQEQTGTRIDIQDDGTVYIAAVDGESADAARKTVESLTEEAKEGQIYTGRVVRTTDFGAFVEILPNTDGLVHISQLDTEHVRKVEDVAKVGDEITVMVTNIDPDGRVRLSRQAVLEGWTLEEAVAHDRPPKKSRRGGRGRSH
jgi:polyribonucleotide nucleotidyltransferase